MKDASTVKRAGILLDNVHKIRKERLELEIIKIKEEKIIITSIEREMKEKDTTEINEKGLMKNMNEGIVKKEMRGDMIVADTNVLEIVVILQTIEEEDIILGLALKAMIGGIEVLHVISVTMLIAGETIIGEMKGGTTEGMREETRGEMTGDKSEESSITAGTTTEEATHRGRTHQEGDLIECDVVGLVGLV